MSFVDGSRPNLMCELLVSSDSPHLQQIYTGFRLLSIAGVLRLTQRIIKEAVIGRAHLKVILNGKHSIFYDTHDSCKINAKLLNDVDVYFKRSFLRSEVREHDAEARIFPLGLNYLVYASGCDVLLLKRIVLHERLSKLRSVVCAFNFDRWLGGVGCTPREDALWQYPQVSSNSPRVLFMSRAFDPQRTGSIENWEVERLNNMRAQCIRLLKNEFGKRFIGGFMRDDYSLKTFKDCVVSDPRLTQKKNYLRLLRDTQICVATTGLHGSVGWKLGEYVSHSKAIVTERLNYEVPGKFANEANYLEFSVPEDCVSAVARLVSDSALRYKLMVNNFRYYNAYVRPDVMVFNTLCRAMRLAN